MASRPRRPIWTSASATGSSSGEILEAARRAVLSERQDRIIELWMRGWSVPEIGAELNLPVTRVSDEKYKALRKLEQQLRNRRDELEFGLPSTVS